MPCVYIKGDKVTGQQYIMCPQTINTLGIKNKHLILALLPLHSSIGSFNSRSKVVGAVLVVVVVLALVVFFLVGYVEERPW